MLAELSLISLFSVLLGNKQGCNQNQRKCSSSWLVYTRPPIHVGFTACPPPFPTRECSPAPAAGRECAAFPLLGVSWLG